MRSTIPAVRTWNLTKTFNQKDKDEARKADKRKEKVVVDHITLNIPQGEFFGLLGPNAAGKTTLTKMLVTLLLPDGGGAQVNGFDLLKESAGVRSSIGHLHGETGGRSLYWRLTGRDNLWFFAYLQDVPPNIAKKRIDALLEYFNLEKIANKEVRKYSTGEKVKTMLARTLLHNPPILILDEPTIGLDAITAVETRKFLQILNKELKKTIIFTSHVMSEVEQLCERIAIIHHGKILTDTTPRDLRRIVKDQQVVAIRIFDSKKANVSKTRDLLDTLPGVREILDMREEPPFIIIRILV
ncbi:MAG: ABC transporter ATP-binding protein, partial [Candidatus Hodarchaeota archaeon]